MQVRKRSIAFLALALTLALLAGCAGQSKPTAQPGTSPGAKVQTPGVTDSEVLFGTWMPVSGNAAAWGVIGTTVKAYFDFYNATKGGVAGRKVKLIVEDDEYTANKTRAAVTKMIERDHVFAFCCGVGTATGSAVMDTIIKAGIPNVAPSTGSGKWNKPPYYFGWQLNYGTEGRIMAKYATQTLKKGKWAIFYQNDDYGKEGLTSIKEAAGKLGAQVVKEVPYNANDNEFSAAAVEIQKAGADAVFMYPTVKAAGQLMNELEKIGAKPAYLLSSTANNSDLIRLAPTASQGAYAIGYVPNPEELDNPIVKEWHDNAVKYGVKAEEMTKSSLQGWGEGRLIVHALETAGKDLTRESFIKALETLNNWPDLGTVTYTATDRLGIKVGWLTQVKDKAFVKVSDPISADL